MAKWGDAISVVRYSTSGERRLKTAPPIESSYEERIATLYRHSEYGNLCNCRIRYLPCRSVNPKAKGHYHITFNTSTGPINLCIRCASYIGELAKQHIEHLEQLHNPPQEKEDDI